MTETLGPVQAHKASEWKCFEPGFGQMATPSSRKAGNVVSSCEAKIWGDFVKNGC